MSELKNIYELENFKKIENIIYPFMLSEDSCRKIGVVSYLHKQVSVLKKIILLRAPNSFCQHGNISFPMKN
jgi:hypothetical protein